MTNVINEIYLASNSPRRWELLQQLGLGLHALSSEIDESPNMNELAKDYCLRMAKEKNIKAQAVRLTNNLAELPILTADTTVSIHQHILGKPTNQADAQRMLKMLSGNTHQVFTAVCISYQGKLFSILQQSDVEFKVLSEQEINAYIATQLPMDKAGAYGIQGIGGAFVKHLSGSFTGVMGLPIYETCELFKQCGIAIFPSTVK
ncbi:Maf family protein [Ursidibacter sp. B-7004-1]